MLKDGVVRALTGGGKEASFCYLDENTVLFAADREGEKAPSLQSRYYKIALDGGEAELAFTFPMRASHESIIPQRRRHCNAKEKPSKHTKKHLPKLQMFTKNGLTFSLLFGKIKRL
mgnify:CR=1 FL=1